MKQYQAIGLVLELVEKYRASFNREGTPIIFKPHFETALRLVREDFNNKLERDK